MPLFTPSDLSAHRYPAVAVLLVVMAGWLASGCTAGPTAKNPESPADPSSAPRTFFSTDPSAASSPAGSAFPPAGSVAPASDDAQIYVDQVGYLPEFPKIAVVAGSEAESVFRVVDIETGDVVYEGRLSDSVYDDASGDTVRHADFGEWKRPGSYSVTVGRSSSAPFRIGNDVYRAPLIQAARSYTLARAGVAIDDPVTGLRHDVGHAQDKQAMLFFEDPFHRQGDPIDVSGGWYDAGDYGKYVPTGAVAAAQLMLAWEMRPELWRSLSLSLPAGLSEPERRAGLPDLLVEIKYELDWLLRMQRPDGAVYLKVAGGAWPGYIRPEEDTADRYVFGLSTYGTAQFAGAAAMGARVYAPFLPDYARKLLDAAIRAQRYLEQHPDPEFRYDEGQNNGSGPYEKRTDREERFWAAAELLRTTDDARYDAYIREHFSDFLEGKTSAVFWGNTVLLGQWAYVNAERADADHKASVRASLTAYADELVRWASANGYRSVLRPTDYFWGSAREAMGRAQALLLADAVAPNRAYLETALDQAHWLFGRNAAGTSFMTGIGMHSPQKPHHRLVASTQTLIPGLVVGGPNAQGGDPIMDRLLRESDPRVFPAKAYVDDWEAYSVNEPAIDYTAPAVFVLTRFAEDR